MLDTEVAQVQQDPDGSAHQQLEAQIDEEMQCDIALDVAAAAEPAGACVAVADALVNVIDAAALAEAPGHAEAIEQHPQQHDRVRREHNFRWGPFSFVETVRRRNVRGEVALQSSWEATCPYHSFGKTKCCKEEPFKVHDQVSKDSTRGPGSILNPATP